MSDRKRKASDSEEPACVLCGREDVDPDICGRTFEQYGFVVHEFCLMFAHIDFEDSPTPEGNMGIPLFTIMHKVKQANQKQCCVCGERGAAITCASRGCERSFHLPCAADGECITQFFGQHRSFCWEHRPQQAIQEAPAEDTTCVICIETVGDRLSYHTLVCPACTHAWFHRGCIQRQALNTGTLLFQCPSCRNDTLFCTEMSTMGIQIPARIPEWVDEFDPSLLQRHRRCDASTCLNPGGREQSQRGGPWQLVLCRSCAAEGTHRQCSDLSTRRTAWECDSCAGLGTAASTISELAGPSTSNRDGLGPSHNPQEHEDSRPGPASQAALGPSHSSQLPELSSSTSEPQTEQGTMRSPFPDHQDTSEQRQDGRGRRRTPAPSAESSSHPSTRRGTSQSSREATAAARRRRPRQRGTSRIRSRSPLQGRAPSSQSRTRRPRGSRPTPAPAAHNRTPSTTRRATRRSLRASLRSNTGEGPRQPGEARTRRRSSVARRATNVRRRP
ncbi:PHD finger protein 7-like isoform X2 [Numida meleagris]|uniref:PHD finger protein 7-like isoform X2 n=1 Tax=Numida meleagris TaxID=8996 RepID=UPI000B3E322A|nr:PHD finger protein 7-like isoform X2 [Numida meleagris]